VTCFGLETNFFRRMRISVRLWLRTPPTLEVEVKPNRVNIDTGAYATGRLTCLVVEDSSVSVIDTL